MILNLKKVALKVYVCVCECVHVLVEARGGLWVSPSLSHSPPAPLIDVSH